MKFASGIDPKYVKSVEDAFATIIAKGDDDQKHRANEIMASDMLIRVQPVKDINGSGVTGLIDSRHTNKRLRGDRINLRDALGEVYISIANETIDTGFQQGCEGTFVHESRHAWDFAQTIESYSNRDVNPLDVFNPTLYDLEWEAHQTAGKYMLQVNIQSYLDEGLSLMILGKKDNGTYFVDDEGIKKRLRESYGLALDGDMGSLASEMMGLNV